MPEIKHQFTGGKMNKDLDERLVPNGQYRDAMNIQVATSEGSNVGAIENILGNKLVEGQDFLGANSICVGSVSHESKDKLYYLVTSDELDTIVEYDTNEGTITPVFIDLDKDVLRFDENYLVNGINIIDDLLFWTDNNSEPKKINIKSCKDGTDLNPLDSSKYLQTRLINKSRDIDLLNNIKLQEKHITVIKKSPGLPLGLELLRLGAKDGFSDTAIIETTNGVTGSNIIQNLTQNSFPSDLSGVSANDELLFSIDQDFEDNALWQLDWQVGDTILFKEETQNGGLPSVPLTSSSAEGVIKAWGGNYFKDASGDLLVNGGFAENRDGWGGTVSSGNESSAYGWKRKYFTKDNISGDDIDSWGMRFKSEDGGEGQFHKLTQSPIGHTFKEDGTYEITYTIENYPNEVADGANALANNDILNDAFGDDDGANPDPMFDTQEMTGQILPRIVFDGNYYDFPKSTLNTPGTYTDTITLQNGTPTTQGYSNHFYFEIVSGYNTLTDVNGARGFLRDVSLVWKDVNQAQVRIQMTRVDSVMPTPANTGISPLRYAIGKKYDRTGLFKDKLVRFSYRYNYLDSEKSTFAPFTEVAFLPGGFDYHAKKGHNIGMTNNLGEINLIGGFNNSPLDVVSIDILAKAEDSSTVYIVDTIKHDDEVAIESANNAWDLNKYNIKKETVKGAVAENQLLRPWDNVPKKALAQDITGSRLVYGNYIQGYSLKNRLGSYYTPKFNIEIDSVQDDLYGNKSIKSLREYQLGVVFLDEFGRETPVISNSSGSFSVPLEKSGNNNMLSVTVDGRPPDNMDFYKVFIKETSSEYYNIPLHKYYADEDNNTWLSFVSSDRNKIDMDTTLILKKGLDITNPIENLTNYKILDIKSEAPDFIKLERLLIEEKTHNIASGDDLFGTDLANAPVQDANEFKINYLPFSGSSGDLLHKEDGELYIQFTKLTVKSNRYKVANIACDIEENSVNAATASYTVRIKGLLNGDVNFIADGLGGVGSTQIDDGCNIKFYKYIESSISELSGKFFVNIFADAEFSKSVVQADKSSENSDFRTTAFRKLYSMNQDHNTREIGGHKSAVTGLDHGAYDTERINIDGVKNSKWFLGNPPTAPGWNNFSKFAVFFRNYRFADNNSSTPLRVDIGNGANENIGMYKFGEAGEALWKEEFLNYTSQGNAYFENGWGITQAIADANNLGTGTLLDISDANPGLRTPAADVSADKRQADDEVWFIDNGPYVGRRAGANSLNWQWTSNTSRIGVDPFTNGGITPDDDNNSWELNLGLGGVSVGTTSQYISSSHTDYFGIAPGFAQGFNPNYADDYTSNFAAKITPSKQFRFKEDPNQTIYTIRPGVKPDNLIRYAGNWSYGDGPDSSGADAVASGVHFQMDEMAYLSPNFSNNFISTVEPAITWNPMGNELGPIDGGYEVTVTSVATTPTASTGTVADYYITVQSNVGTDPVYGNVIITKGMIMTSYDNGDEVLENSATTQQLLVKDVQRQAGNEGIFHIYLTGYVRILEASDMITPSVNETIVFQQPTMNGYSENSTNRINLTAGFTIDNPGLTAVGYTLEFVEAEDGDGSGIPDSPAVFETETKNNNNLDVYYEASGVKAARLNDRTILSVLPVGSIVESVSVSANGYFSTTGSSSYIPDNTEIIAHSIFKNEYSPGKFRKGFGIQLNKQIQTEDQTLGIQGLKTGEVLKITKPNNEIEFVTIKSDFGVNSKLQQYGPSYTNHAYTGPTVTETDTIELHTNLQKSPTFLNWHNCYSFGNGVESNRIKDNFNEQFISNGFKVSTTLDTEYKEEHRKYGLIYSGIYNSNSGVNNLNQFIQAEKITKDINPTYGSIQKLHARDGDLVALCEDKILKILANKDAVFNANGNTQLVATSNVLGQTIPFVGEYGISKNPESFASENYRAYFTDKVRGTVMRLSMDGLTPISSAGMKDWFKDNLKLSNVLLGSYDDQKDEYNITLKDKSIDSSTFVTVTGVEHRDGTIGQYFFFNKAKMEKLINQTISITTPFTTLDLQHYRNNDLLNTKEVILFAVSPGALYSPSGNPNGSIAHGRYNSSQQPGDFEPGDTLRLPGFEEETLVSNTLSFSEDTKGWTSFKSFTSDNAISCANNYYTMKDGLLWKHNSTEVDRNNFYGEPSPSTINVLFNESPGSVKSFHTLNYEGTFGWKASSIETNKEKGSLSEFIEKEGKWFNYIRGVSDEESDFDSAAFNVQGIGVLSKIAAGGGVMTFNEKINTSISIGDTIYVKRVVSGTTQTCGIVSKVETLQAQIIELDPSSISHTAAVGDYVFFVKNGIVNQSSLLGYYADVKFENNSTDEIELFSIGSEVTESSK